MASKRRRGSGTAAANRKESIKQLRRARVLSLRNTAESSRKSLELFGRAIRLDRDHHRARADYGHEKMKHWRNHRAGSEKSLDEGFVDALAALASDPDDWYLCWAAAIVARYKGTEWDLADVLYERARKFLVGTPDALDKVRVEAEYAEHLVYLGETKLAVSTAKRAVAMPLRSENKRPLWVYWVLAWAYHQDERYGDAIKVLREIDVVTPLERTDVRDALLVLAASHAMNKDSAGAADALRRFRGPAPGKTGHSAEHWFWSRERESLHGPFGPSAGPHRVHWIDSLREAKLRRT